MKRKEQLILVRGGGDIASGTIYKLLQCGYSVLVLETEMPSAIRRYAAFSEAVYDGVSRVEDKTCRLAGNFREARKIMETGEAAMLVDPDCRVLKEACPFALVDAILAKKNLGTSREMAPKTIALGPGFQAGRDADLVIETMRGHQLGRVIHEGSALPDTGVPGLIQGYGAERVIHAPAAGRMENLRKIGDIVKKGEPIARILGAAGEVTEVPASLDGLLRGLIRDGYPVTEGFKIADIAPRQEEYDNCFTISDKARCIAGGVLEGILFLEEREEKR